MSPSCGILPKYTPILSSILHCEPDVASFFLFLRKYCLAGVGVFLSSTAVFICLSLRKYFLAFFLSSTATLSSSVVVVVIVLLVVVVVVVVEGLLLSH